MFTLVLFQQDFRLHDHPALFHAAENGRVATAYITQPLKRRPTASDVWRHHALLDLQQALKKKNQTLILRQGDFVDEVLKLIDELKCDAVHWHRSYEKERIEALQKLRQALEQKGVQVHEFEGTLLLQPEEIVNGKKEHYQVFTPFWKRYRGEHIPSSLPEPETIEQGESAPSLSVDDLDLLDSVNWYDDVLAHWKIGERAAIDQWLHFREETIANYAEDRDFPAKMSTSLLSPHLACGSISARALWASGRSMMQTEQYTAKSDEIDNFLRQLVWREFSYYQLHYNPDLDAVPLRKEFEAFPWLNNDQALVEWQKGQTGYPLIDAGMRELYATGFMHNRVRMVSASFLVKHLLIEWQKGYEWFKETLIDFNVANNGMGWQWVAGCGADAAPYFRVFNPILQSEKFDGKGDYIRKWLPELENVPDKYIHAPFEAPERVLEEAGVELGRTYPFPIVDHKAGRKRALEAYDIIKKSK